MASTFSTNLAIELIGTGDQAGTWGTTTNSNLGTLIEQAISGYVTQAVATGTDTTITIPNGATGVARNMYIELTGTGGTNTNLIVPANKKLYFIFNNSTGAVTVKVSGQTGVSVPTGKKMVLVSNGTDIVNGLNYIADFGTNSFSVTNLTASSGTITNLISTSGSITNLVSSDASATVLRAGSATLTNLIATSASITNFAITNFTATSATITNLIATTGTITTLSATSGNITNLVSSDASATVFRSGSATLTHISATSATITNLNSTSANITTLTGTTFGTTATTQLRGASGQITTLTSTSANITTLTGTTVTFTSGTVTTLTSTSANITTLGSSRVNPRVSSTTTATSLTPSIAVADQYAFTALASALTINAPIGTPLDGNKLIFRILDNGTSRALTWNATYTVIGVTLPTATTISKTTYVGCIYNANNTRWDVVAVTTQA
jgi:trimeric autotransporter adhesin